MKKFIISTLMTAAMFGAYSNAHAFGNMLSTCSVRSIAKYSGSPDESLWISCLGSAYVCIAGSCDK